MLDLHLKNLENIINSSGERVEGNIYCDITTNNIKNNFIPKQNNLKKLALKSKKICEIGFNAGHSALFMLESNPKADYLFFDLNYHKYTDPCFSYLKKAFPATSINIIYGDSTKTLKKFAEDVNNHNIFDLIHIDGGHEYNILKSDFENSFLICEGNGNIIIDDTDLHVINNFVTSLLSNFFNVKEIFLESTSDHRILQKKQD